MNRHPHKPDDSLESDPVWKLLDQAPAPRASERFVERTLRVTRLEEIEVVPFWRRLLCPAPLAGLCGAVAAVVLVFMPGSGSERSADVFVQTSGGGAEVETFAAIQEAAEMEALLAAVDQMDDFSDHELVSLIGF